MEDDMKDTLLDRLFEGTIGLFVVLFFGLILMPTFEVLTKAVDALGQLWAVVKNPSSIVPDKLTFAYDGGGDCLDDQDCCS